MRLAFAACSGPSSSISLTWQRIHDQAFMMEDDQIMTGVTAGGPGWIAVGWVGDKGESSSAAVWISTRDGSYLGTHSTSRGSFRRWGIRVHESDHAWWTGVRCCWTALQQRKRLGCRVDLGGWTDLEPRGR